MTVRAKCSDEKSNNSFPEKSIIPSRSPDQSEAVVSILCASYFLAQYTPLTSWSQGIPSGSGNTIMKNLAASLKLHFCRVVTSLLLTPCATLHGKQIKPASELFFPLLLKKHTASFCLWLWSLHLISHSQRFFSSGQVHFKGSVHRSNCSCKRKFTH